MLGSRFYDPTKGLSRAMDLRIDQVLKALDGEHSLPSIQERSWIPWLPPREGVLRFRSTQYINFHGSDRLDTKLNRKVEVLFKASELGLSAAAQVRPLSRCVRLGRGASERAPVTGRGRWRW
jgi:hypothetical protein